jgi:malonyl-CoA decarboxylase
LNWLGDPSERALSQAYGLMVNYLYDLGDIEKNHEAYATQRTVVASNAVTRLVKVTPQPILPGPA